MQLYKLILSSFFILHCGQQYAAEHNDVDTEMYQAIEESNISKVLDLLSKGSSPNSMSPWGSTNLGFAVMRNNIRVVELFLDRGANPDLKGDAGSSRPIIYAIANRNTAMVKKLLDYHADPLIDRGTDNPIEFAQMILGYPSLDGHCHPIVDLLLKKRAQR